MSAVCVEPIVKAWESFKTTSGLGHISDERQYDQVVALMDRLSDKGAMELDHHLHDLFMFCADLVRTYEEEAYPLAKISGVEMLRFLIEQNGLRQTDLVNEIGSQGVVSEILSGKRELNKKHIASLAKRFTISPAAFF